MQLSYQLFFEWLKKCVQKPIELWPKYRETKLKSTKKHGKKTRQENPRSPSILPNGKYQVNPALTMRFLISKNVVLIRRFPCVNAKKTWGEFIVFVLLKNASGHLVFQCIFFRFPEGINAVLAGGFPSLNTDG